MLTIPLAQASGQLILSNTVMGFAAGVALLLLIPFARYGSNAASPVRKAWAWCFGMLGAILAIFGIHTVTTWPLLEGANLIFGEPSVVLGGMLIAAAFIIHQTPVEGADDQPISVRSSGGGSWWSELWRVEEMPDELMVALRPIAYVGAFTAPMMVLFAVGGSAFSQWVFRPPPTEVPTGVVAGTGIEIVYMIVTYALLALGALLLPVGLHNRSWLRPAGYLLVLGAILILFLSYISMMGHVSMSFQAPPGGIPWPPS